MGEGMIQGSPGSSSSRFLHIPWWSHPFMRMAGLVDLTVSSSSFSDPTVGLVQSSLAAALILCSLFAKRTGKSCQRALAFALTTSTFGIFSWAWFLLYFFLVFCKRQTVTESISFSSSRQCPCASTQALTANLYVEPFLFFIHIKITKKKFLSDPSIRDYKVNKLFKTTKKRREVNLWDNKYIPKKYVLKYKKKSMWWMRWWWWWWWWRWQWCGDVRMTKAEKRKDRCNDITRNHSTSESTMNKRGASLANA